MANSWSTELRTKLYLPDVTSHSEAPAIRNFAANSEYPSAGLLRSAATAAAVKTHMPVGAPSGRGACAPRNALGSGSEARVLRQPAESGCQQRAARPETRSAPVQRPKCCASRGARAPRNALGSGSEAQVRAPKRARPRSRGPRVAAELARPETRSAPVQRPKRAPRNALGLGPEAHVWPRSSRAPKRAQLRFRGPSPVQRPKCCASQPRSRGPRVAAEPPVRRPKSGPEAQVLRQPAESGRGARAPRNALGSGSKPKSVQRPKCCASQQKAAAELARPETRSAPVQRPKCCASQQKAAAELAHPETRPAPVQRPKSGPEAQVLRQPAESGRGARAPRNALGSGSEAQVLRQPAESGRGARAPRNALGSGPEAQVRSSRTPTRAHV